ncbi:hypothetical protein [Pelomonas cellulosilytica]|uniref:Uncharacterized protein n=1 Tax=Pelomonas cellulosilytica TaxID=2906762 RepID=A0ABS8XYE8_9BURK|nr:hypothetical protein [Pelomonas sp. P8]MCE4554370.1 hypothetical protein [Pelomonas sp. P8]
MSRAQITHWAHTLWAGLCHGLCETGAMLAMQNGCAVTVPGDAARRSEATSGV